MRTKGLLLLSRAGIGASCPGELAHPVSQAWLASAVPAAAQLDAATLRAASPGARGPRRGVLAGCAVLGGFEGAAPGRLPVGCRAGAGWTDGGHAACFARSPQHRASPAVTGDLRWIELTDHGQMIGGFLGSGTRV